MLCDAHMFKKPSKVYLPPTAFGYHFWFSAREWYARKGRRRECQCKLNTSEHVDLAGPYSLPPETVSKSEHPQSRLEAKYAKGGSARGNLSMLHHVEYSAHRAAHGKVRNYTALRPRGGFHE